jgi:hypothetical protein
MTPNEIERSLLWNSLTNHGDYIKLNLGINEPEVLTQLTQFKDNWCPYNQKKDSEDRVTNNRWGLPVTSRDGDVMNNYHLNSFGYMQEYHNSELKESDFTTPTEVYHAVPEFKKLVDIFSPDIGRVHLLRVDQGGFFPPHRDFAGVAPEYFRLTCVFGNASEFNYAQQLDDKLFRPNRNSLYFVNFQLNHSVFSFSDNLYNLILTVKLNRRTHDLILKHSTAR